MTKKTTINKIVSSKAFWIIISLLGSFLLWMYIMSTEETTIEMTFSNVKVVYQGADDLRAVRAALRETGAQELKIFAKIENMTGLHRLDEILPLADVVVIARGDLGNAMPLWELPRAQTLIASKCRAAKRPFMVSTQMLHSMHHAAVPTRAEVTDVYQAARSGADYLLLTGETAVGEYPVEAMTYFAKIAANGWADAE